MTTKSSSFWDGFICGLSEANVSHSVIVQKCKKHGLNISKAGVGKIIRRCNQQPPNERGRPEKARRNRPQPSRSADMIRNIRAEVLKENPPTQRSLAARKHTSQSTVWRVINENLNLKRCYKARGHKLTEKHIRERMTNARKLYEKHLAGDKWQWVATLDEAWIYMDNTNKPRAIFYRKRDGKGRSDFVRQCREKFSKGFMVVAGYCARGKFIIKRVEGKAKINAQYYQTNIMEPLYNDEIPRLYGTNTRKVWIHMDKASSHTARSSLAYYQQKANETGINIIPFSTVPVKSPDASPMDYCGFGLLKRGLATRRPKTVDGLWKLTKRVWNEIPMESLRRSLLQWKLRCRAIVRRRGNHIEHNRWWRKGIS